MLTVTVGEVERSHAFLVPQHKTPTLLELQLDH